MSKFIKLKGKFAGRVLVNASQVALVNESDEGSIITLFSGEEVVVKESYQTVVNRLTKGDAEEASE